VLSDRAVGLAVGALVLCALLWFQFLGAYRVDDVYIVYRYAENLAAGEGFAFNPGERVEGVTCFLWTLFLAGFALLPLPLHVVAPGLSALAGLAVLVLSPGLSASSGGRRSPDRLDASVSVLLATNPAFAFWSMGALETVPLALLLVLAYRTYLSHRHEERATASACWGGLATLLRPETPLILLPVFMDRLMGARLRVGRALRWAAVVAAFFLPFLAFRILYFGDWLPNTYYAKSGAPLADDLANGIVYSLGFLVSLVPAPGLPLAARIGIGSGLFALALAAAMRRPGMRLLASAVLLLGAAIVWEGGDWMVMWRFWVPVLPFVYVLIVALLRVLRERFEHGGWIAGACVLVLAVHGVASGWQARTSPSGALFPARPSATSYHHVAGYLDEHAAPGDAVALMDIGQIGYETDLRVIDISGLTEPWIARSPGGFLDKQYPITRLLDRRPRFFVLRPGFRIDWRILGDQDFRRCYRPVLRVDLYRADERRVFERVCD